MGGRRGLLRRRVRCVGRDDVIEAFRRMIAKGELSDPNRWTLHDALLVGELAAVTFSWSTPAAKILHLAHVMQLATGRIVAIQRYASRA